jgi:cytosine/adenosine deaminase-related metal-dependent hydrolase
MDYRKYQAEYLFTGSEFLPAGKVLVTDLSGKVISLTDETEAGDDILRLPGMLLPGFINCHCHLELSHMKGMIAKHLGMTGFLRWVVQNRAFPTELIQEGIIAGESEMLKNGIVAVGDISNTTDTAMVKSNHRLRYINFIEALGFNDSRSVQTMEFCHGIAKTFQNQTGFSTSIVPHAPYTIGAKLFELIEQDSKGKVISMHNQESWQENEFMLTGTGDFREIFEDLKMDLSDYYGRDKNSLQFAWKFLDSSLNTLLIHNVTTTQEDIDILSSEAMEKFYWCLCVNANLYINNMLPPIELFRKNECKIVLGTDSLASNDSLSVLDEIKAIRKAFPSIPQNELLTWATRNGAEALNISNEYGSFEPGKTPGIIQINLLDNGSITEKSVVHRIA